MLNVQAYNNAGHKSDCVSAMNLLCSQHSLCNWEHLGIRSHLTRRPRIDSAWRTI